MKSLASDLTHTLRKWNLLTAAITAAVGMAMWCSSNLIAQEFRASITGQVADSTGALIPGASITLVNADTGVSYVAKSDSEGAYSVLYIQPGKYTVTVTVEHFEKMVYNDVVLNSAQQLGLNVTLKPGNVAQQVEVTADAVDLDTRSPTIGGVIDPIKLSNMPSTGMEVFDDVSFTEGIRSNSISGDFNITPRNPGNTYTASGMQTDENAFYLNGAPTSDQGSWYFVPSVQATSEVQASALPYDAQYGRTGGGTMNANVKNGTNAYHGSVYEFYSNQILDANTWTNDLSRIRKPINIRNTFGGESGGPIRKDKTFYFGSFEQFDQHEPQTTTSTVPTAAELTGNFSGSGYTIYDPLSTQCVATNSSGGCTTYGRTAFPNDTIPSSEFSKIGQAILALYPPPLEAGATNNYVAAGLSIFGYRQYIVRVDQNFSQHTRMYGMWTHQYDNTSNKGNDFPGLGITAGHTTSNDYNIIADLAHDFSSSIVGDLKASYMHYASLSISGDALQGNLLASALGFSMPVVATTPHQGIAPDIAVSGYGSLIGNTENGTADADADFSGSVTQLIGHHNLHYGAEFLDVQTAPTGILGTPNGAFTFDSTFTQGNPLAAAAGQGNGIADVLLGYPTSGSVAWNEPTFITYHYYGAFIQDTYQARPNLSLNLGLRWDVNKTPSDRQNRINDGFCLTCTNPYTSQINFANAPALQSPLLGGLQFAGVNGAPSAPFKVQWNHWQPRVGFTWAALPNTVIRGGYGIYFPWGLLAVDDIGFSQTTSFVASLNGNLTPDNYLNSGTPYPNGAIMPTGSTEGLETGAGNAISYNDTSRRLRMTQHWSFGVQRKMPASILLAVDYLASNNHSIPITTSLDVIPTALQQACNLNGATCNTNVANPFYGVLPANASLGKSTTIPTWELQRAYPLFNGVSEVAVPAGDSWFNSLNVHVERRVQNLNFVFSYAYSKWMDRDSYLNNGNFRDANPVKQLDPSDIKHTFAVNIVYPLPSTSRKGLVGALANGWLFDSTAIVATGNPLGLPSTANFNWGAPGCTSYAPQGAQTRSEWFNNNESCWTSLGTWQPLTTPAYIGFIRDPRTIIWNPAFHKQFSLPREGMFLQYRMEGTNGANHPCFSAPNTSLSPAASFSPSTSWTGFGTLPTSEDVPQRQIYASLKLIF